MRAYHLAKRADTREQPRKRPRRAERLERHAAQMRERPEARLTAAIRRRVKEYWDSMTPDERRAKTAAARRAR